MVIDYSIQGKSLLHRWDPRAKIAALAFFLPSLFLFPSPWMPGIYSVVLAAAAAVLLGTREVARSLRTLAPFLLIIILFTPIFNRAGSAVVSLAGFPLFTMTGVEEAARMAGRFVGVSLAFFAVFRTLNPDELVLALRWYRLPYRAALSVTIALRLIPTLLALSQNVRDAHTLRRADERRIGFFARTLPQLSSVLIQSVRMIPSLAMALETRGFGRKARRTDWMALPGGGALALSFAAAAAFVACAYAPFLF
jgi:energy-coupling factor transport system permease protein